MPLFLSSSQLHSHPPSTLYLFSSRTALQRRFLQYPSANYANKQKRKEDHINLSKTHSFKVVLPLTTLTFHGRDYNHVKSLNNFGKKSRMSLSKVGLEVVDLVEENDMVLSGGELEFLVLSKDVNNSEMENGRLPMKEQLKIVTFDEKGGRLPTRDVNFFDLEKHTVDRVGGKEVAISDTSEKNGGSESLAFVERTAEVSEPEGFSYSEGNCRMPTKGNGKSVNFIEENDGLMNNKMLILDSVEKAGKLQIVELVEWLKKIPLEENVEIIDFFGEFPSVYDFNNFLIALVKAERTESGVNLFSKLPAYGLSPNSRTYSIMVQCFCKKSDPDEAKRILDQMIENGFTPNVITFTMLINCFCKRGRLQKAFKIFEIMGQVGCDPTVQTYNCLINGLCYVGRVEEANALLNKIKKSPKTPDIFTYTAVMDGFCKVGRSNEGFELLEEASAMGLKPNVVTFNTLFNGYCKEGRPLDGIHLLKVMEEKGCRPDIISYSTLLHGLLKWNEISAGLRVYEVMSKAGLKLNERMMNTLVREVCRKSLIDEKLLNDAVGLFERIKLMDYCPSPYTYCLIIQALAIRRRTENALDKLIEMVRLGYPPRIVTYNGVIRALCGEGRVNEAWLVLMLIAKGRTVANRVAYNLLIDAFNQQGRWLDACKVYGIALKKGVDPHQKPRENIGYES